jgi:hypothetical protein
MNKLKMRKRRLPLIRADAKQKVVGCVTALTLWFYIIMLPRAWKSATIKLHNYPDLLLQGDRCRVKCWTRSVETRVALKSIQSWSKSST